MIVVLGLIAAVIGGLCGSTLNKKLSEKTVKVIFTCVMGVVFAINVFNVVGGLI